MAKRIAVFLVALLVCASCQKFAEGRQLFRELLALRDQIATQFHEKVVDVKISTGGALTVTFVNSPLNSATREVKQKRADEVAEFVISHYKHPLPSVSTQFASGTGPVRVEETFVGRTTKNP
jgi:hypothetical protein